MISTSTTLEAEIAQLLAGYGSPPQELHGVGSNVAAVIVVAQAGDVRRFRDVTPSRFCSRTDSPAAAENVGEVALEDGGLLAKSYADRILPAR